MCTWLTSFASMSVNQLDRTTMNSCDVLDSGAAEMDAALQWWCNTIHRCQFDIWMQARSVKKYRSWRSMNFVQPKRELNCLSEQNLNLNGIEILVQFGFGCMWMTDRENHHNYDTLAVVGSCDTWYVCFAFSFHNLSALSHMIGAEIKFSQIGFVIDSNGLLFIYYYY